MNKFIYTILFTLFIWQCDSIFGQSFLNGSFEYNALTKCEYNISDIDFDRKMPNVYAFGKTYVLNTYRGEADIHTKGCYVEPYDGNWCIGVGSDYTIYKTSDAIALELSAALKKDNNYKLSFYAFGNISFSDSIGYLLIGESEKYSELGLVIDTVKPIKSIWKEFNIEFTAQQNSKFITVKNQIGLKAWNQVDNFIINEITDVADEYSAGIYIYPNPVNSTFAIGLDGKYGYEVMRIYDIFGKLLTETKAKSFDLSSYPVGYYYVNVIMKNRKSSLKILKI